MSAVALAGLVVSDAAPKPGFTPPDSNDFVFPAAFGHSAYFTKPILLIVLSVVVVFVFYYSTSRKAAVVPSKLQFAGESVYGFVRNSLAQDVIGHEFMKYVPYLVTLFSFILVNNIFGIIPFIQFPSFSRFSFPLVLALIPWILFNWVGIRKHGFGKYFKTMLFPPGVPKWVYILLTPIEFVSTILVRPLTLSLRLFANMFAGHLLLLVFILGGDYMLHNVTLLKIMSPFAFVMGIALTFFEFLVQCLQAYIFTLLSALYIAGALADEH